MDNYLIEKAKKSGETKSTIVRLIIKERIESEKNLTTPSESVMI